MLSDDTHVSVVRAQALSPHYAYYYFRDNRHLGWIQCSGLFLAITGACLSASPTAAGTCTLLLSLYQ